MIIPNKPIKNTPSGVILMGNGTNVLTTNVTGDLIWSNLVQKTKHEQFQEAMEVIEKELMTEQEQRLELVKLVLSFHNNGTTQERILDDVNKLWKFIKQQ